MVRSIGDIVVVQSVEGHVWKLPGDKLTCALLVKKLTPRVRPQDTFWRVREVIKVPPL